MESSDERNGPRRLVLRPFRRDPAAVGSVPDLFWRDAAMLRAGQFNAFAGSLVSKKKARQSREKEPGFRVFGGTLGAGTRRQPGPADSTQSSDPCLIEGEGR